MTSLFGLAPKPIGKKSCHWLQRLLDRVLPHSAGTIRLTIGQAFPTALNASLPQAWPALSMPEQDVLSAHCQLSRWLFDAAGNWPTTSNSFQAGPQIAICHPALVEGRNRAICPSLAKHLSHMSGLPGELLMCLELSGRFVRCLLGLLMNS